MDTESSMFEKSCQYRSIPLYSTRQASSLASQRRPTRLGTFEFLGFTSSHSGSTVGRFDNSLPLLRHIPTSMLSPPHTSPVGKALYQPDAPPLPASAVALQSCPPLLLLPACCGVGLPPAELAGRLPALPLSALFHGSLEVSQLDFPVILLLLF